MSAAERVSGTNNATYGPVPRAEQIFKIEFLEVAPSPLPMDQIIFVWLRGKIVASEASRLDGIDDYALANATLDISLYATFPDGSSIPPKVVTIPLRTRTYREDHHIAFRNFKGDHVDRLSLDGPNDILADAQIISYFVRTGTWTFDFMAKLPDGTCLFAVSLTQYLQGVPR